MKSKQGQSYLVLNFSTIIGLTVINICLIRNLFLKSTMSWNIHRPVYSYYGNSSTPFILIASFLLLWAYMKYKKRYLELINALSWGFIMWEMQDIYAFIASGIIIFLSLGNLIQKKSYE